LAIHRIWKNIEASEYRPSREFPPLGTFQALEYEHMGSGGIGSSAFKNQVLVRFNHIIYIWQGVNSTTPVIPFRYALFELLAGFTNFHFHTPWVCEKG